MRPTGIVKKLDKLYRLTLSKELRDVLGLVERDYVELIPNGSTVVIKRYNPNICVFCGNTNEINMYKGKCICNNCIHEIRSILGEQNEKD